MQIYSYIYHSSVGLFNTISDVPFNHSKDKKIKLDIAAFSIAVFSYSCTTSVIPFDEDPDPIIGSVTYDEDVKSIMDNNCTACHGTVSPQAGLSLVTYSQVRNAAENGNLIARMNDPVNPMPESGRLDASIRALIDQWAEDGFFGKLIQRNSY